MPLFLSEIAPVQHRGAVNILFQLFVTIGIFFANLVNYATSKMHPWGWRFSLGLAGLPAVFLFIGSIVITETQTSLIEHGNNSKGRKTLERIRGVEKVDAEFNQMASEIAKQVKHPFKELMKRSSRPPLVIALHFKFFSSVRGLMLSCSMHQFCFRLLDSRMMLHCCHQLLLEL